jgi:hypothetical protein
MLAAAKDGVTGSVTASGLASGSAMEKGWESQPAMDEGWLSPFHRMAHTQQRATARLRTSATALAWAPV